MARSKDYHPVSRRQLVLCYWIAAKLIIFRGLTDHSTRDESLLLTASQISPSGMHSVECNKARDELKHHDQPRKIVGHFGRSLLKPARLHR